MAALSRHTEKRVLLLHGPVGSSKSTIVRMLKKGIERYSQTQKGALYTFEWETEGWPFWGNMHHVKTYWDHRHLANFKLVHYSDMLADLEGTVRTIAAFIEHEVSEEDIARVVEATTFATAKQKAIEADAKAPKDQPGFFRGGQASFIFKGTNGRWKGVLTSEDLELYEAAKERVLSPDCARWLETGGKT